MKHVLRSQKYLEIIVQIIQVNSTNEDDNAGGNTTTIMEDNRIIDSTFMDVLLIAWNNKIGSAIDLALGTAMV